MKSNFKYFTIIFLLTFPNLFLQDQIDYSPKVEEFMNIVEEKYENLTYDNLGVYIAAEKAEYILKKLYDAIADDPAGFRKYIVKKHIEGDKKRKENPSLHKPKFGMAIKLIEEELTKYYDKYFIEIIKTPYYLKVNLISKKTEPLPSLPTFQRTKWVGKIEEVIKGEKKFNTGEVITFYTMSIWETHRVCKNHFKAGKTYFIPITVTEFDDEYSYNDLAPNYFNDENCGVYEIKDGDIIMPNNYFNISEKFGWSEFKTEFSEMYLIK